MLTLWKPFNDLARFHDDLFRRGRNGELVRFTPAVDIEELEDRFVLSADLPGIDEKDLEITVHDGVLVLSGKREVSQEEERDGGLYRERSHGSFCRQFRLGPHVDPEKIEAHFSKGVLQVTLPKKEEAKPKQIPVATN